MTQTQRVLKALETAGPHGVTQADFDNPTDGQPPIRRLAARIFDLKHSGLIPEGFEVYEVRDKNKFQRYMLRRVSSVQAGVTTGIGRPALGRVGEADAVSSSQPVPNALFDMPVEQPKRADWWEVA